MSKIEVLINGKAYPCRQTMGAMLRFKKETGKEVTDITSSPSDMLTFLYCCTQSACAHDGVKFDLELMDFADSITPEDLNQWTAVVSSTADKLPEEEEAADAGKKKKLGILDLLGVAVGCIGLSYAEFCGLEPSEFSYIYEAYNNEQTARYRDNWAQRGLSVAA